MVSDLSKAIWVAGGKAWYTSSGYGCGGHEHGPWQAAWGPSPNSATHWLWELKQMI